MRVFYRLLQTWRTLTSKPKRNDLLEIQSTLSPDLFSLFNQMHPSEQAHSIAVYRDLLNQKIQNKDLLEAALLHDAGKNQHPLRLWERVVIVLGNAFFPENVKTWSDGKPEGLKRPFVVAQNHPEWGADLASQAGASKLTADLIRRHQDSMSDENGILESMQEMPSNKELTIPEMLSLLQRSDNLN
jgi:hypothetical protein